MAMCVEVRFELTGIKIERLVDDRDDVMVDVLEGG